MGQGQAVREGGTRLDAGRRGLGQIHRPAARRDLVQYDREGKGSESAEAGGGNGAHERGAPPPVAPEGGAGLGVEIDQGGRTASTLEIGDHMDGQGGLAGATWLGARGLPQSHAAAMPRSQRRPAGLPRSGLPSWASPAECSVLIYSSGSRSSSQLGGDLSARYQA